MQTFHFYRKGQTVTMCGISCNTLHPNLKVQMLSEIYKPTGREFDRPRASLDARNQAKLPHNKPTMCLADACRGCLDNRRFEWPKDHGITAEDVYADDDENWRRLERERHEKTVD